MVACAPHGTVQQRPDSSTVIPDAETYPLKEQRANEQAAYALLRSAQTQASPERETSVLDAAAIFLDNKQAATAKSVLNDLDVSHLPDFFDLRKQLLRARVMQFEGNHAGALSLLDLLGVAPDTHPTIGVEAQLRQSESLLALGQYERALTKLIQRQRYLVDRRKAVNNQRRIWATIESLDGQRLQDLRNGARDSSVRGWADLGLIYLQFGADVFRLDVEISNWHSLYPQHPADTVAIARQSNAPRDGFGNFGSGPNIYLGADSRIALLLPLSSSNSGRAAQALHDGFMAMHDANTDPLKPTVHVYDIGQNVSGVSSFYDIALTEGADFIVGPLGKDAVNRLIASTDINVPMLLLGSVDDGFAPANTFQFSLLPEQEAAQVARRAWFDGRRIAAVLYPQTDRGNRVQQAFELEWQTLGGLVAESSPYQPNEVDFGQAIKSLLNIDTSEARAQQLNNTLGQSLTFSARRRDDVDFIFLAANSYQGRLMKPQINFHHGHDLAVYATSNIYTGKPDRIQDADLDGVIFGDMPWLLLDSDRYSSLKNSLRNSLSDGPLARLFALGVDAYTITPQLSQMLNNPGRRISGATAALNLTRDRVINRQLVWAQFAGGVPQLLDSPVRLQNQQGQLREQNQNLQSNQSRHTSVVRQGSVEQITVE